MGFENPADREILCCLASSDYIAIERTVAELRIVPDAPTWSNATYLGVTSKIELQFDKHNLVTKKDLEDFFLVAQIVLSEIDPALDLPLDKQWAANIYGKMREHSGGLRLGICETLVLLAAHGNNLFRERLGIDVQSSVDALVRALLLPLNSRTWASQKSDLPRYAEAAPEVFLDVLEQDLAAVEPKVHTLMQPAQGGPFGGCPRTGLLWALETLAWKPDRLLRVSLLLAKLAELPIRDNWSNKPDASVGSIYRAWMPQTAATIDERNAAMETICRRSPIVGWRLLMDQFGSHHSVGHYSSRPLWRNDASGAGQTVKTYGEIYGVADKARELALSWPQHDQNTLGDLVERLHDMKQEDHDKVWNLVNAWAASNITDAARHELRERIRKAAFTRRARIRKVPAPVKDRAREAYALLAPQDLVMRHLWLFAQHWIDESSDELEEEGFDFRKREARISALRNTALSEIWQALGYDGVIRLCSLSAAENIIGWQLADGIVAENKQLEFLDRLIGQSAPPSDLKIDNFITGFLLKLEAAIRKALTTELLAKYLAANAIDKAIRLFKCSTFRAETWAYLDQLPAEWQRRYWNDAYVRWEDQDENESNTLVARLIEVNRPRAAFYAVHMDFDKVDCDLLAKLLLSAATSSAESSDKFQLNQHEVSEAFKSLRNRHYKNKRELTQLEFMYVPALEHSDYGIPTLEEALTEDQQLFMQLIALVYRRNDDDDREDPPEWEIEDDERRKTVATSAYTILHHMARIPGTNQDGSIDAARLQKWVEGVRALASEFGREKVVDSVIGEMLGRCDADPDGVWPCEPVRQVLDVFASPKMANGMSVGRYNTRGAHFRGPSGDDERTLSAQYRAWAKAAAFQYPFTAKMLEEMASSYDREAVWHDTEANVRKRVNY